MFLQEEVLMVQEAKPDCYKQWYLPAGRVEVGESLEEALRREVRKPLLSLWYWRPLRDSTVLPAVDPECHGSPDLLLCVAAGEGGGRF